MNKQHMAQASITKVPPHMLVQKNGEGKYVSRASQSPTLCSNLQIEATRQTVEVSNLTQMTPVWRCTVGPLNGLWLTGIQGQITGLGDPRKNSFTITGSEKLHLSFQSHHSVPDFSHLQWCLSIQVNGLQRKHNSGCILKAGATPQPRTTLFYTTWAKTTPVGKAITRADALI